MKKKSLNNLFQTTTLFFHGKLSEVQYYKPDYVDKIKGFFDGFCFNFSGFDSLRAKGVLSK